MSGHARVPDAIPLSFLPSAGPRPWRAGGSAAYALTRGQCIRYAICWQLAAFGLMGAQLLLVSAFGWVALLPGVAGLMWLYASMPLAAVTVFLQILLYQNWFLSVFSGTDIDQTSFQMVQGWGFAAVAALAGMGLIRTWRSDDARTPAARVARWTCFALLIILAYTVYGAIGSSPMSAMNYLRNTSAMLLALLVGLDLGRTWHYRTFATIFVVSILFGLFLGACELLAPYTYFSVSNAVEFWNMKLAATGRTDLVRSVDALVRARVVTWFNITGGAGDHVSIRISGPNMHPISFAYVIAVTGVVAATLGFPGLVVATIALLLMAGIKGPLLMLLVTIALFVLWSMTRRRNLVLIAAAVVLVAYVGLGISIGLSNGDFHVIGFLGGVRGFLTTPQGHGIGVGGNLSALASAGLEWKEWQGSGADFALESAVGVLLYQMGIGAIAVYVPLIALVRRGLARRVPGPIAVDALFIGIAVTLANGVFQEEAYSPYALGLLALLGGIAVGNTTRTTRPSEGLMP